MGDFRPPTDGDPLTHIVSETGLAVRLERDGLSGRAQVVPELHVPGSDVLRTSVLAAWVDVLTGVLAMGVLEGRVPVTLDLAVDVVTPVHGCPVVEARCRVVKAGSSVAVLAVDFTVEGMPHPVAVASATFVPVPDRTFSLPSLAETVSLLENAQGPLRMPLAERCQCIRLGQGTALLPRLADGLNATATINGALLAVVAEEAVLGSCVPGTTLSSLAMRYLRPARTGPVIATATSLGALSVIDLHDQGEGSRLVATATARAA